MRTRGGSCRGKESTARAGGTPEASSRWERGGRDLWFVLASALACAVVFFSCIMPKIQANRAARTRLAGVCDNTREIVENIRAVGNKEHALRTRDPFFLTASLRWYLEMQAERWSELKALMEDDSDAGHPESGRG